MATDKDKKPILIVDREGLERLYLSRYEVLRQNRNLLDLLLFHHEFLARNPVFRRDLLQVVGWEKRQEFMDKWNCEPFYENESTSEPLWFVYLFYQDQGPITNVLRDQTKSNLLNLNIDLRYSKGKILQELERIIDAHKAEFEKESAFWKDNLRNSPHLLAPFLNNPQDRGHTRSDPADYERYLKIWDMRNRDHFSWRQIENKWNNENEYKIDQQTARNWYKAAERLIKEGIPGFHVFPKD